MMTVDRQAKVLGHGSLRSNVSRRSGCCWAERAQGTVEFALVLLVFVSLVFGIFDLGRSVWDYNMISEAARVGARAGMISASGAPAASAYNTVISRAIDEIIPGAMTGFDSSLNGSANTSISTTFCTATFTGVCCLATPPYYVRVTDTGVYTPNLVQILGFSTTITMTATSDRQIPS